MTENPKFWMAISFTIFISLAIKYILPLILKLIDAKSKEVDDNIKQAINMKLESESLLKNAKEYYDSSIAYSNKLIDDTNKEVENLLAKSQEKIEHEVSKRLNIAKNNIKQEELNAIKSLKKDIIESSANLVKMKHRKLKKRKRF